MIKKIIYFLCCAIVSYSAYADECSKHKRDVSVNIKKVFGETVVKSSDQDLVPIKSGFVNIQQFYQVSPKTKWIFNGKYFCIFLDSVDIEVGFKDFVITIDKNYQKDSCEYNAVLKHEKQHISDAKKAFEEVFCDISPIINKIVKDINPIMVKTPEELPVAAENIRDEISKNPKLTDLHSKYEEKHDKYANDLDSKPDEELFNCVKDKVDAAFEKFYDSKVIEK